MSDELALKSAVELAALIRERKISALELLDLYLARIERFDRPLNAVVTLDPERARARARELDRQLARTGPVGPLHGLALTIKDTYEVEGMRTTAGAAALTKHVPARNALTVQRLVDAGAIVFGKTNVPAYAADVQSYNEIFGVTNNPHDLSRSPGGSSGGAAVAVACGFTAFELGSDIGGSIRTPSNWTGVYGHKPSHGLVPQRGHIPGSPGALTEFDLVVCGPLARSAQDLGLALELLAGPDAARAKAYQLALPAARAASLAEYRIGVWLDDAAFPVDAEVQAVLERALQALAQAGARLHYDARPELTLAEVYDNYRSLLTPIVVSDMPEAVHEFLAQTASTPRADGAEDPLQRFARDATQRHVDWLRANERRERYKARWASFFERYDLLLCPVGPVAAIAHDTEGTQLTRKIRVNGAERPYMDLLSWISLATAAHLPATVAPAGRTPAGLPVGLQIIGPYLEDRSTLDFAQRIAAVIGGFVAPHGY